MSLEIKNLIAKNFIRTSKSTWLNNLRPVVKENGSVRITTNLIALNRSVELDYSLPNIEKILSSLKGMKYFSKIDLKDGFFHVPLREEDKHKTAFRFKHQLYEWNVMPMGFKNAPAVFQRYMDNIFSEEIGRYCYIYVDDILIFGRTKEEHRLASEVVTNKIKQNGLQINDNKSIKEVERLEFLGHIIEYNKLMPKYSRVEALKKLKRPVNIKSLQEFLGLINYYRKFIKNCAYYSGPLYDLLKIGKEFVWKPEHQEQFEKLVNSLCESTYLAQPDFDKPFILETDACSYGLGAILSQMDKNEKKRSIAYASRKLKENEIKFSISEKECLAVIWGMEYFKYYLYGKEFKLITDHEALEVLNKGEIKSSRIQRWMDRLKEFNYITEYKKGIDIPHVDAISRLSTINTISKSQKAFEVGYCVNEADIKRMHETLVHRGYKTVLEELKKKFKTENINAESVKRVVDKCIICKKYNSKIKKQYIFVKSYFPGEKVAIDIIGPVLGSFIMTGIDYFTRKASAKVSTTKSCEKVVSFLKEIYSEIPFKMLILDQSKENLSLEVKSWADLNNITLHYTSPFHHQSNGRVERLNRTIQEGIFKMEGRLNLKQKLKRVLDVYNNVKHSSIECSPNEALKEEKHQEIKNLQLVKHIKMMDRLRYLPTEKNYKVGDIVLIKKENLRKKADPLFPDRGIITNVLENNSYILKTKKGALIKRHASQIKLIIE